MLEFERSRDTTAHVEEIQREVQALENALQKTQSNEKKYRKVIKELLKNETFIRELSMKAHDFSSLFRLSKIFSATSMKSKIV